MNAKADGKDGIGIVVIDLAGNPAGAFAANYPEFPDSCMSDHAA
jgi:hypothetical protein